MAIIPRGLVHQKQLQEAIQKAKQKLPDAIDISYHLDSDSTGEPSIFFHVVLTKSASREDRIAETTGMISKTIFDEIQPYENWGLNSYFNFGSEMSWKKTHSGAM